MIKKIAVFELSFEKKHYLCSMFLCFVQLWADKLT